MGPETFRGFIQLVQLSTTLLIVTHPSFAGLSHRFERRDVLNAIDPSNPRFDVIISAIDAYAGETVLLPCTVRNLGDKVVSWIRTQDLSILTSAAFTFSADSRFESVHNAVADFWGLRIRGVRSGDAGQYECQVNTDPKMNLAVNLSIIDGRPAGSMPHVSSQHYASRAHIKSAKEVFVRSGSTLALTCEVTPYNARIGPQHHQQHRQQPEVDDLLMRRARVRWLHEAKEISSKFDGGGVSVETDYRQGKISSRLILNAVQPKHSGRYTCTRPSTREDTIRLYVNEDHVENMQRDSAYTSKASRSRVHVFLVDTALIFVFYYWITLNVVII